MGLSSCQIKEDIPPQDEQFLTESDMKGMTKLGKQLENPYSVENMRKAYTSIKSSISTGRIASEEIEIKTTHLYLKFKPQNEEELSILKRDSTLILFEYPMDHVIIESGEFYHDPTVPIDKPTYQYTAVKVEKDLPTGVDYEVLAELFIPDEKKDGDDPNGRIASDEFIDLLVDEALKITGNLDQTSATNGKIQARDWRPAGRIRVWDDQVRNYVPVVDVEVRAKRWFTVHKGTTNSQGVYSCDGTFNRQADYSIQWEKYHFSVRTGTFGQAENSESNITGNWNRNYGANGSSVVNNTQQYYALIFQAARDYYYGGRFGLSSPPRNGTLHPQVKIAADITERQNDKPSHAAMYARTGGIFPSIYVRTWGRISPRVYAVTVHELAHAAHWDMDRSAFRDLVASMFILEDDSRNAVIESWASGVEWQFAQERYKNLFGISNFTYKGNYQHLFISPYNLDANHLIYTSIVVDMIDNCNQRIDNCNLLGTNTRFKSPQDRVNGYTILEIERGLKGSRTWNEWRNNMIDLHTNNSEVFVYELFSNWY
jgi:hypothetical protein